jgi:hypothetical protein
VQAPTHLGASRRPCKLLHRAPRTQPTRRVTRLMNVSRHRRVGRDSRPLVHNVYITFYASGARRVQMHINIHFAPSKLRKNANPIARAKSRQIESLQVGYPSEAARLHPPRGLHTLMDHGYMAHGSQLAVEIAGAIVCGSPHVT